MFFFCSLPYQFYCIPVDHRRDGVSIRCVVGLPLKLLQELDSICFCTRGDHEYKILFEVLPSGTRAFIIVVCTQNFVVKKSSSDPLADEDFLTRKFITRKFLNTKISRFTCNSLWHTHARVYIYNSMYGIILQEKKCISVHAIIKVEFRKTYDQNPSTFQFTTRG